MAQQVRLNWLQKRAVKKVIKKAKKKLKQQRDKIELTANEREQIIVAITKLNEIGAFELTTDDDEPMTDEMIKSMKTAELTDTLKMQIEELEKWV